MKIRTATLDDSAAIRNLVFNILEEYGLKADPESTDADLENIELAYIQAGGAFDVLENESGELIGSVGLYPLMRGRCELRKMYLSKTCRGQGMGKALLEHALQRARELGFHQVELETASVLKEAIYLYKRYGFKPLNREHLCGRCDQAYFLELA